MPKILRIINRLNLGGPTFNAAYLTKHLAPEYETLLLAGMKDDSEASSEFILQDMGLQPRYISDMHRSINPLNDVKALQEIKKIIREFRPDIVHTHAAKAGALGRLAAKQCGVPVIVHTFHGHVFHSYFNPLKTKVFIQIERYLAGISTGIIAISELQKKELSETFKICAAEKIKVIPLGFDLDKFRTNMQEKRVRFRKAYNITDDEIAVGIVGRLVPVKNHSLFLEAIQKVRSATNKRVRFFIVGDGEERQKIEAKATALGIDFISENFEQQSATLTFTSWLKDIDRVNAGVDIIALTSMNEGTPVSIIEAQAADKPIVSTRVGGMKDIVSEGETALLSEPTNSDAFSNNLLKMIEDDDFRFSCGSRGSEMVMQKFSYQRLVSDMREYYDMLLMQKKKYPHANAK